MSIYRHYPNAFLTGLFLVAVLSANAQTPANAQTTADTSLSSDKNIRNKVLSDIQDNLDKKTKNIDLTISPLDHKVDSLDIGIAASRDARDKADKLLLRVQSLEKKQQSLEENELYLYQANYQSAIINLGKTFVIQLNSPLFRPMTWQEQPFIMPKGSWLI